jgi:threonine/homoserine/homoserine lactone efflux protein
METNFFLFLLYAVGISLSGVMLPGPLTAATIAKGYNYQNAGFLIGLGHAIVELPIILLIYFGFARFIAAPEVKIIVGVLGGILLIVMGAMIIRTLGRNLSKALDLPYNPLVTGIVMTGANPYFFLWWATIGLALIATAATFGITGLIVFVVLHWLCDIGWEQVISITVFKTKHLWTDGVQKIVFGVCAAVLIGFGIWFCVSVFL